MARRYYFAYGSNLNSKDWDGWCSRNGFSSGLLQFHSVGVLPDHELAFTKKSDRRKGGVLDVVPRPGQLVPGVVFEVEEDGWKALDRKEGDGTHYEQFDTIAFIESGEEVPVSAYRVVEARRKPFILPSPEYLEVVRDGYKQYGLPMEQLNAAAKNRPRPWAIDSILAYGTLRNHLKTPNRQARRNQSRAQASLRTPR